jgi:hypothetical protein
MNVHWSLAWKTVVKFSLANCPDITSNLSTLTKYRLWNVRRLEMFLSVFKMVRVGWRPCPNFPRHYFYILTNPLISMEQPQTRRPRSTRLTWFPKIKMAQGHRIHQKSKVKGSTENVEPAQIKNCICYVPPTLTRCPSCSGQRTRSDKDQINIKFTWPQCSTQLTLIHVWF